MRSIACCSLSSSTSLAIFLKQGLHKIVNGDGKGNDTTWNTEYQQAKTCRKHACDAVEKRYYDEKKMRKNKNNSRKESNVCLYILNLNLPSLAIEMRTIALDSVFHEL